MSKFLIYFLPIALCLAKSLVNIVPRRCADDKNHLYGERMCLDLPVLVVNAAFQLLAAHEKNNKISLPISLTSSSRGNKSSYPRCF